MRGIRTERTGARASTWTPETKAKARTFSRGTANALKGNNMKSMATKLFGKKAHRPKYTVEDLEKSVYDYNSGRARKNRKFVTIEGLVSVDGDEAAPRYLIRTLTEWPGFLHGLVWMMTSICSCVTFPLTFMWNGTWSDTGHYTGVGASQLFHIDIALDAIYTLCLLLLLNMSYMNHIRRVEVVRRDRILHANLLSPVFWLRLSTGTIYFLIMIFDLPLLFNNVKLIRYLHMLRYPDSLWKLQDRWILILLRPIVLLVLASHWMACLMICLGGYREVLDTQGSEFFDTTFDGNKISGYFSLYLMAYVESLYMLTGSLDNPLGEGDGPRNKSFGSLVIVSVFGPIGCVITALLIAAIMRQHALKFALDIRHEENKEFIKRALQNLNIPRELQRRVFSLQYYQKMSHDQEAFSLLFKKRNLSPPLESALRIYLYHDSVLHSTYFKEKDHNYILEVIKVLQDQIFLPGDFVTRRGEVDNRMFFVARGELAVLVPSAGVEEGEPGCDVALAQEVATKTKGEYFGEVALIKDCVRTAWVRSDTYVLVSTLERGKIEAIWRFYPQERESLVKAVAMVSLQDRERRAAQLQRANGGTFTSGRSSGPHAKLSQRSHRSHRSTGIRSSGARSAPPNLAGSGPDAAGGTPAQQGRSVTFITSEQAFISSEQGNSADEMEQARSLAQSAVCNSSESVQFQNMSKTLSSDETIKNELADCMTHTDSLSEILNDEVPRKPGRLEKGFETILQGLGAKLDEIVARQNLFAQELLQQQSALDQVFSQNTDSVKGQRADRRLDGYFTSRDSDRLDEIISRQISLERLVSTALGICMGTDVDNAETNQASKFQAQGELYSDKCRRRSRRRKSNCSYGQRFSVQSYKRPVPTMLPPTPVAPCFARKSFMQVQFSDLPGSSWIFPSPVLPSVPHTLPLPVTARRHRTSHFSSKVHQGLTRELLEAAQGILAHRGSVAAPESESSLQSSPRCSSKGDEPLSPLMKREEPLSPLMKRDEPLSPLIVVREMMPGTNECSDSESTICGSDGIAPSEANASKTSDSKAPQSCSLYGSSRSGLVPRFSRLPEAYARLLSSPE